MVKKAKIANIKSALVVLHFVCFLGVIISAWSVIKGRRHSKSVHFPEREVTFGKDLVAIGNLEICQAG